MEDSLIHIKVSVKEMNAPGLSLIEYPFVKTREKALLGEEGIFCYNWGI